MTKDEMLFSASACDPNASSLFSVLPLIVRFYGLLPSPDMYFQITFAVRSCCVLSAQPEL
jgi:hypothetical protein